MENQNTLPSNPTKSQTPIIIAGIIIVILSSTVAYLLGQKSQSLNPTAQRNQVLSPTPTMVVDITQPITTIPTIVQPTQQLTNNWQTYQTSEFSVQIPIEWKAEKINDGGSTEAYAISSGNPGRTELSIYKKNMTADVALKNAKEQFFPQNVTQRKINLGDLETIEYYGCFGVEGCINQYILFIPYRNSTYEVYFNHYDNDQNIYNDIIKTLRFK